MARDLFEEAGIKPAADDGGRDLFEEAGIKVEMRSATARDYARAGSNAIGEGVFGIQGGIGNFLQAPGANLKSYFMGANAVAGRYLATPFEDGDSEQQIRDKMAQDAAAEAEAQRAENRAGSWYNPRALAAKFGALLQEDARARTKEVQADNAANNPELVRQQQAVQDANGFIDTLRASKDNPLATGYTLARSAPDMALGAGIGKAASLAGSVEGAVARASVGGTASEALSSANTGRESVYQQVMGMPIEQLVKAPRYQQLLAKNGDPSESRQILANELADQVPVLTAAGTALGTIVTNKLFGGDATAKTIVGAEKMTVKELGKRTAQDATEEVLQGLPEDAVAHAALVQADPNHQLDVGGSIAQNAIAGTAMGAGGHGAGFVLERAGGRGHAGTEATPATQADASATEAGTDGTAAAAGPSAAADSATAGLVEPSPAETALLTPRGTATVDRVHELDGQVKALEERMAELNGPDYGPMFDSERLDTAGQLAALDAQRQELTKGWPAAVGGAKTSFSTEAGVKLDGHYALMDAGDLVTSHDTGLRKNPEYPQELQPRERDRAASEMQVSGITQKLDPARLGLSADAATGAPIVGADGLVESGNARSIALKRIYSVPGQRAAEYRQYLRDNAQQFGLSPEAVDGMQKPVLVRVRDTPVDRAEFARQANAPTVAAMSPSEQARADAKRIDTMEDLQPDEAGDFSGPASRGFVRRFMARLPATEQAAMVDGSGALNSAGYARIRNAVLAKAYGDSPVLTRMVESMDDNLRNVSRALTIAAPRVAQMRDAVDAGARHKADITPDLMESVEELSRLKDAGQSVSDALAQHGLMGETYSPEVRSLLQFLGENARRPRRMADFIVAYQQALDDAGHPGQGSLLEDAEPPTKSELMGAAQRSIDGTAEDTQRADAAEDQPAGAEAAGRPAPEARDSRGDEGNGPARSGAAQEVGDGWKAFGPETGTLGIPRVEMPQVKVEHRGALVNFLEARGIAHSAPLEVPASSLKATQAEYSPSKVEKFKSWDSGTERSVLVSSDGYVLDGHHQWLADDPVRVIMFDAPIRELIQQVREFPSVEKSTGAPALSVDTLKQLDDMRERAAAAKPDFDARLTAIAQDLGGRVQLAQVKGVQRASAKIASDYGGDASRIKDLLRGTIVVDSAEGAQQAIAQIEKQFDVLPAGRRNLLSPDSPAPVDGYRDAKMNVRLPDGLVAEIQVNVPQMLAAKKAVHSLYEQREALVRAAEGRGDLELPAEVAQLNAQMRDAYEAAWAEATSERKSASEMGAPLRRADSAGNERGIGNSQQTPSEGGTPAPTVTGMPSTSKNSQFSGNLAGSSDTSESGFTGSIVSNQGHIGEIQKVVDGVTANWKNAPEVVVVSDLQDPNVPKKIRDDDAAQKALGASGEPTGFFHKGKVYLVAGEIQNELEAVNVLLHESLGHYGLRGVFGDDFKPLMRQLSQARPDLMHAKAREYGFDLDKPAEQWRVADEMLAELAMKQPELGFVKRAVALVRTWLRKNIPGFKDLKLSDAEIIQNYIVPARDWVQRGQRNEAGDVEPAFMRTRPEESGKTAAERADDIINDKVKARRPLDMVARAITRMTGIERAANYAYERASYLLDRYTPERVKAGFVSDHGVPEAVKDQRALLQGRQRVQLRKAGDLIDKLSMMTRAESQVAYAWLNEADPHAAEQLAEKLPAGSREVLEDVRKMIDRLSRDAVRLGQLTPEAYERNKFSYLRRSYAKYVVEQATKGEKARRSRVISILGEQYKGRGLTVAAPMSQIQNAAPDWWKRKVQPGKADTSLKGEKFVRLEKRAPSGEGNGVLEGMEGKAQGKLQQVHYWPEGEPMPAKYSDWDQAGTWEVRDVKGGDAIMWRDFTKAERQNMGEVDEARFAIAKTLHGMIHDVEVGRYLEWLAQNQALKPGAEVPGQIVDASERYRDTFKPGEFVQVPETKIPGTQVNKYGKLAGRTLPGPVWNDLRQTVNGQFKPFGEVYAKVLQAWKTAKTALSPAVHMNNVMSNFVMADWRDVSASHVAKALRLMLSAHDQKGEGVIGRAGNLASRAGIADREAARELLTRYTDSGGDIGGWATQELARGQIEPLLAAMEDELKATNGESQVAQVGVMTALQHALQLRLPSAWEAFKGSKTGKVLGREASSLIDVYQAEDDVFRLAAWLKAKEEGASDLEAGKAARKSFLDYNVNAPWVQAMRSTAWPFVAFSYRAIPMLAEIAGKRPHKLLKLMALAGALNALGYALSGGDEDKERKLLPEEKAGRIWGMVPKLIRMPWNDGYGSPVFLDIRRFVPVGDVFDVGQGQSAVPILPGLQPGGPLVVAGEVLANKSMFTGKAITQGTDTPVEQAGKVIDHLYKAFAPNLLGLPGTYATAGLTDAMKGRTDAFGREMSPAQAVGNSIGVKVGSYPADVARRNLRAKAQAEISEIDKNIGDLKRQLKTNRISPAEFQKSVQAQFEKKQKIQRELAAKLS